MTINLLFKMKASASARNQIYINTDKKTYVYSGSPLTESGDVVIKEISRTQIKNILSDLQNKGYKESRSL